MWLQLALRQHELCWRRPATPDEKRVVFIGNSAVFGHAVRIEQTFGQLLNDELARRRIPAHVFNLGWIAAYQLKDALILHEALPFRPDVVVYPVTLSDFVHTAPALYPALVELFQGNRGAMLAFEREQPPGLSEPLGVYRKLYEKDGDRDRLWAQFRELGTFVRAGVRANAQGIAHAFGGGEPLPIALGRQLFYDCDEVRRFEAFNFRGWQRWNTLAYLEHLRVERGVQVLIVNWPVAHEPLGVCYNFRYTKAALEEFRSWIAEDARRRGLAYVDLQDLLAPTDFMDSLHLNVDGHRRIAGHLLSALAGMLPPAAAAP
jgi:hypothetical protein